MNLTLDLSQLPMGARQSFMRGMQHEDRAKYALGVIEQLRLKRLMDQCAVPGFNKELGRTSMAMSADQWKRAMDRYGQQCHQDADFSKWLVKKHPEFGVKDVGTKVQSGWTAGKG